MTVACYTSHVLGEARGGEDEQFWEEIHVVIGFRRLKYTPYACHGHHTIRFHLDSLPTG